MSEASWRDRLRGLTVFGGQLPAFDTDIAPDDPAELLAEWLAFALETGVSQPHAMTIATVDREGAPSARTLLLKDITPEGLWFATLSTSPKGRDLAENPRAALLFYWREHGRQIRVTGSVETGSRALARLDFLTRHPNARAIAAGGQQSEPLPATEAEYAAAVQSAREQIAADPGYVPEEWQAYLVRPAELEFWQAARERDQLRLRYLREGDGWRRELLWP
jgi:pyridoxamine 5'-phosphate oxidase